MGSQLPQPPPCTGSEFALRGITMMPRKRPRSRPGKSFFEPMKSPSTCSSSPAAKAKKQQFPADKSTRSHSAASATPSPSPRSKKAKLVPIPTAVELAARTAVPTLDAQTVAAALVHLQKADPQLAGVIAAIGNPTSLLAQLGQGGSFKALTKSIVYQQLSVTVAAIIFARLMTLCGGEAAFTPAKAMELHDDDLRTKCGFSYRKAQYR